MAIPNERDAREIIGPEREARIWRAVHAAWDDVAADIGRYSIWPRSRANMMFERLAVRLQEEFSSESAAVRFFFADETVKVLFDGKLLVRFKKANGRGLGQNVETTATFLFCEQELDLLGFAGYQKIEIVYVVNAVGTAIRNILVQARNGNERVWAYPINRPEIVEESAPIVPLPLATPTTPAPDASDLVQPRKTPVREEETDSEK
jgi:hypothetical protein